MCCPACGCRTRSSPGESTPEPTVKAEHMEGRHLCWVQKWQQPTKALPRLGLTDRSVGSATGWLREKSASDFRSLMDYRGFGRLYFTEAMWRVNRELKAGKSVLCHFADRVWQQEAVHRRFARQPVLRYLSEALPSASGHTYRSVALWWRKLEADSCWQEDGYLNCDFVVIMRHPAAVRLQMWWTTKLVLRAWVCTVYSIT